MTSEWSNRQANPEGSRCQATAGPGKQLLGHLASDLGKHIVRVAANESDRANYDYQDYSEHHRILGDVLTAILSP